MSQTQTRRSATLLRASEVGQWTYCQRAWWLAEQGHENRNIAALQTGVQEHERHARQAASANRMQSLAVVLFVIGGVSLAAALFLGLFS